MNTAVEALNDINENNDVAAVNAILAFVSAVEAQRGNKLTNEQADDLVQRPQQVLATLN